MLIETEKLIKKLKDYLETNPECYFSENEHLSIIIHAENKLIKKFIRYLESLG